MVSARRQTIFEQRSSRHRADALPIEDDVAIGQQGGAVQHGIEVGRRHRQVPRVGERLAEGDVPAVQDFPFHVDQHRAEPLALEEHEEGVSRPGGSLVVARHAAFFPVVATRYFEWICR